MTAWSPTAPLTDSPTEGLGETPGHPERLGRIHRRNFYAAVVADARQPADWCDPPEAFGQLTAKDNKTPIRRRVWLWEQATTGALEVEFRAAVIQNVIALYVRQAKNARPHPTIVGRTMPLKTLVAADQRKMSFDSWQRKMTGQRSFVFDDLAVIAHVLPDALPPEHELGVFLRVAQKQSSPPEDWSRKGVDWPDA